MNLPYKVCLIGYASHRRKERRHGRGVIEDDKEGENRFHSFYPGGDNRPRLRPPQSAGLPRRQGAYFLSEIWFSFVLYTVVVL